VALLQRGRAVAALAEGCERRWVIHANRSKESVNRSPSLELLECSEIAIRIISPSPSNGALKKS
jgi:hypothetical protein